MSQNPSLNKLTFHEYSGKDPEKALQMAQLFIDQSIEYTKQLNSAYHLNSYTIWHDTAHGFKGMAAFAGAEKLQILCAEAQNNSEAESPVKLQILNQITNEVENTIKVFSEMMNEGNDGILSS